MNTRVRFAPSPTGPLHIGGVRTALFCFLYARKSKGSFLIRIEDTDRERSRTEYETEILESLKWLGLRWDEEVVRQSDRLDLYRGAIDQLLKEGHAYTSDEGGRKAVKFKMPTTRVEFDDLVHGKITFSGSELGDFVIQKSDGFPTYHLASVVDDHEMRISHVIRGDDHVSNTPRHLMLYRALGWTPPQFAHLPLVLGPDKTPLSKRHADVSLTSYRKDGYLPHALLNYLALLGWSPGHDREILDQAELEHLFSLKRVNKTGACFDSEKLKWINTEHVRKLSRDDFLEASRNILGVELSRKAKFDEIALLFKERISVFRDLQSLADYFFKDKISYDLKAVKKHLSKNEIKGYLEQWIRVLESKGDFSNAKGLESLLRTTCDSMGVPAKALIHPTRVAISGRSVTPSLFDVMALLGKEVVLRRLQHVTMNFQKLGSEGQEAAR